MILRTTYLFGAHIVVAAFFLVAGALIAEAQGADSTAGSGPLANPLNFGSIPEFLAGALKALAMIALPIITLFLVISGFLFITAQGSEDKLKKAKLNFMYVIIGALLILGAWIIATLIAGTVNQLTGTR